MNNRDRVEVRRLIAILEDGERQNDEQDNYWNPAREAISKVVQALKMLIGDPL